MGYHFARLLLARGHDVVLVDDFSTGTHANANDCAIPDRCTVIEADVCHPLMIGGPVDYVANLACPASPVDFDRIPIEIMRACSEGAHNLLNLALHKGASFLQASTSEVYGDPEVHPQQEGYTGNVNITGPRSVYDEGKRYAEAMCFAYQRKYGVRIHVARIFNTYGPRMRTDDGRVISNFFVSALAGQPLTLYGGGRQTRSFCYVSDLARGLLALMTSDHPGPVNLGNPTEHTMVELAEKVLALTGSTGGTIDVPLLHADDPKRRRPDITRARELLGWEPEVSLDEGLAMCLPWVRQAVAGEGAVG